MNNLSKNAMFFILTSLCPMLFGLFTLPIVSRYLGATEYGKFAIISIFVTVLTITLSLQIYSSVVRFCTNLSPEDYKVFFTTSFVMNFLISMSLLSVVISFGSDIIRLIFPNAKLPFSPIFLFGVFIVFLNILSILLNSFLKFEQRARLTFKVELISTLVGSFTSIFLIVFHELGLLGAVIGMSVTSLIKFILLIFKLRMNFVFSISTSQIRNILKFSLPLLPHALGGYLFMYADLIILQWNVSLSVVAVYSISDRFSQILKFFVNGCAKSIEPVIMKKLIDGSDPYLSKSREIFNILLAMTLIIYFLLCLVSDMYISYFLTDEFFACVGLVPILAISYIFRILYIPSLFSLYFEKRTKMISVITIMSGLINVSLNIIFIPIYGISAAVVTTILAFGLNMIGYHALTKRLIKTLFSKNSLLYIFVIILLYNSILFYDFNWNNQYRIYYKLMALLICLLIFSFKYKKTIKNFINIRSV